MNENDYNKGKDKDELERAVNLFIMPILSMRSGSGHKAYIKIHDLVSKMRLDAKEIINTLK